MTRVRSARSRVAPQVLRPSGGVPAHVAGEVKDPYGFQQGPDGDYFVFDRRAHTVWRISPDLDSARAIVTIGQEQGRLYSPSAFDVGPSGTFVVADAPGEHERVQVFDDRGTRLSGFTLPGARLGARHARHLGDERRLVARTTRARASS